MNNKVSVLALVFLISLSVSLAAVSIKSTVPDMSIVNASMKGNVIITSSSSDSYVDVIVMLPAGATIDSWKIDGVLVQNVQFDTKNVDYMGLARFSGHWLIKQKFTGDATIEYNFRTISAGTYDVIALATYQGGFTDKTSTVTIMPSGVMTCGDGNCESWENEFTCAQDCALPTTTSKIITYDMTLLALGIVLAAIFVITFLSYIGFWSWLKAKTLQSSERKVKTLIRAGEKRGYSFKEMSNALRSQKSSKDLRGTVSKELALEARRETHTRSSQERSAIAKDRKMLTKLEKIARKLRK